MVQCLGVPAREFECKLTGRKALDVKNTLDWVQGRGKGGERAGGGWRVAMPRHEAGQEDRLTTSRFTDSGPLMSRDSRGPVPKTRRSCGGSSCRCCFEMWGSRALPTHPGAVSEPPVLDPVTAFFPVTSNGVLPPKNSEGPHRNSQDPHSYPSSSQMKGVLECDGTGGTHGQILGFPPLYTVSHFLIPSSLTTLLPVLSFMETFR